MKIAEGLEKRGNKVIILSRRMTKKQKKYQKIGENIFTRRVYRGLFFPIRGKISTKDKGGTFLRGFVQKTYFFIYRFVLVILALYLLKKHKIDFVLDRSSSKGIGVFSGFLLGIPTIIELLDPDYNNLSMKLTKKIFAYTKSIINPSFHHKVKIISAGVDPNIFKPAYEEDVRSKYNLKDKKVVVYVGAMSAWHGAEDLIEIANKLDEDVRFLMVGKGLNILEGESKEESISSRFIFTGFVEYEDVPKYISAADVAVAPYNPKGFRYMEKYGFYFSPIKIFEYMACRKPVVASDVDIIRDIINENRCGLLAKPGDAEDFAEKIRMLMKDGVLREKFGDNGRNAVIEKYTWEKVADKIYGCMEGKNKLSDDWGV
ncbi:MAG: glycosyltransferase family 4 protein [Methanocellales archaeon]|nr:glycosyltransferase family 4 protein [Methanocellales archaeon]